MQNPLGIRYGRLPGFALSGAGRAQVERAAQALAAMIVGPVRIASSPLQRALESASILANALRCDDVRTDARFIEARSTFDGLRYRRDAVLHLRRWLTADERDEPPSEIARRMRAALIELVSELPLVVVSHQLPIQYLRASVEHPSRAMRPWHPRAPCETGSITAFHVSDDPIPTIQVAP